MASRNREGATSPVSAVQAVFDALEPLDDATRQKVLASVTALLGMTAPASGGQFTRPPDEQNRSPVAQRPQTFDRPKSLVELIHEKQPKNNAQKIALFAYYRERVEGNTRFAKADLRAYFATAKEKPAGNYDRDFAQAAKAGWIHEDGADSYLTSKGLEAVESGFTGIQPANTRKTASPRKVVSNKAKPRAGKSK
jgi:hypothetical protein